jgi:hypothetical protein
MLYEYTSCMPVEGFFLMVMFVSSVADRLVEIFS